MKQLTFQDRHKFESLNNVVIDILKEFGYNTFYNNYERLCEMVETAKRRNKRNNSFLKDNDFAEKLYQFSCYDEDKKELVSLNVSPKKENTVKH